jgi:hypothetical protein
VKLSNLMRTKSKRIESKSKRTESKRNQSNRNENTEKFPYILKVLEVSELFESNRNEINRIKPNRIPSTHQIREFHCRKPALRWIYFEKKNFFFKNLNFILYNYF